MSILFASRCLALLVVLVAACPVMSVYTTHTLFWYLDYGGDTIRFPSGQIDMAGKGIMGLTMDATAQVKPSLPTHLPPCAAALPLTALTAVSLADCPMLTLSPTVSTSPYPLCLCFALHLYCSPLFLTVSDYPGVHRGRIGRTHRDSSAPQWLTRRTVSLGLFVQLKTGICATAPTTRSSR